MRKSLALLAAAAVVAAGSTAWAGPKDKVSDALIDPTSLAGTAGTWDNFVTAAKVKSGKCKIQFQIKDLGASVGDGDIIICVAGADVRSEALGGGLIVAGNSIVMAGPAKKGKLKLKADLAPIGCGATSGKSIAFSTDAACYADDGLYAGPDDLTNWKASCAAVPMAPIPSTGGDNLLGLCQGATPGVRINPPASAQLAVQGSATQ